MRSSYCILLILLFTIKGISQKSPNAKLLFDQAKADTLAKKDSIGAIHFYQSAQEELKISSPDYEFATKRLMDAAQLMFLRVQNLKLSQDFYYEALEVARKAKKQTLISDILRELGVVYDKSKNTYTVFLFPTSQKQETVEAYFPIMLKPEKNKSGKYVAAFAGGSNDGVYQGAEGFIYGKYSKEFKDRENTKLGKIIITQVYPNFSIGQIEVYKSGNPFYDIYIEDMAAVPIRFPKKIKKDILLEVSLLNIRFVDNSKDWLVHPRTLMYYGSPQLEKDVYASMKNNLYEIWDMLHADSDAIYHKPGEAGRFKGRSMMDALMNANENDLKAFLGFVISFPGKYMGGTWKVSEVFATWVINNSPVGSNEAMDSLLSYYNNDPLFKRYVNENLKDIKNNFFDRWLVDAQEYSYNKEFLTAYKWNDVLQKLSTSVNSDSLLAWCYFNRGLIYSEENKDTLSIEYYKKAKPLFHKAGEITGESYSINNIGHQLQQLYKFKESQSYYEEALQLRLQLYAKDTADKIKQEVARAYSGIGYSLFKQSKNKEAIDNYIKGSLLLKNISTIGAKNDLALLYSNIGKSYQQMGQYKEAADYYDVEYGVRKALGDEEAMADAFDNEAYLLSLLGKNRESYDAYKEAYRLHIKSNHNDDAGFSMSNVGQMLWVLGKFDSAITAHNMAIELRNKENNKKGEAYSWKKLGGLYKENGQPQKSIDAYNKALALYKEINDKENYAALLEDFASNYKNVKDYATAIKYYKDALNIYREINSRSNIANENYNLATVYYDNTQYEESEKFLDSAIAMQNQINDQSGLLYSYIYKGLIQQYFYGDYNKAIAHMKQALQLAVKTTSESNIAYSQSSLGGLYENIGMYDTAVHYFNLALAGYTKLEDQKRQADMLINKGYFYTELAEYTEAQKFFNEALVIAEKTGNKNIKANALSGISQLEYLSGNFIKAIEINDQVITLWKQEDNPWGIASSFLSLGNIRNRQSEFGEAILNYQRADSLYQKLRMEKSRASSINNIGTIYYYQGDYEKALPQFFKALQILQKTNDDKRFIALIKGNIGEVYTDQKKYAEAEKWLNESLALAREIKNKDQIYETEMVLARLKTATKDYTAAKALFEDANILIQQSGEKPAMVQLETDWGKWFFYNKDFQNAEKHLQNSIDLSNSIGLRTYVWKAYATMAEIRNEQNKTTDAVTNLEKAIKVVEELKNRITGGEEAKKIFANDESVVDLYQKMAKYLKMLGRNDEALAYIEKSNIENIKLRLKNDAVAYGDSKQQDASNKVKEKKTEINQYVKQTAEELSKPQDQQNKEKIARLEKMTTVAEADYQQFIIDLAKKYPGRTDLQQIDARQFKQERKYIPQDVALLSYLLTDHELSVFVVMKDTLLIKDIPVDRKLLEQKIKQFYTLSAKPANAESRSKRGVDETTDDQSVKNLSAEQLSEELYGLLIEPAKAAIKNKKRIAIVPSGLLCFVPFQSLATKDAGGNMQYFGEDKQVFYVNKITTVTNGRNEVLNDLKIVAVGNADNSLKNAETEVKSLHQIFPTAMVYVGNEATKKNVLGTPGEYNILHLATHGILDYSNAENSYLVFAFDKTNGDDGKLKINDIYRIKNLDRFRMVTLSACETAVVQNIADGWPISTASAFIEAGVPTVIATLWKVDDKATSLLIEKFYENMKTMDKVAALQNAQTFLRQQKEYADPYYWAPFQLVGLWQ